MASASARRFCNASTGSRSGARTGARAGWGGPSATGRSIELRGRERRADDTTGPNAGALPSKAKAAAEHVTLNRTHVSPGPYMTQSSGGGCTASNDVLQAFAVDTGAQTDDRTVRP